MSSPIFSSQLSSLPFLIPFSYLFTYSFGPILFRLLAAVSVPSTTSFVCPVTAWLIRVIRPFVVLQTGHPPVSTQFQACTHHRPFKHVLFDNRNINVVPSSLCCIRAMTITTSWPGTFNRYASPSPVSEEDITDVLVFPATSFTSPSFSPLTHRTLKGPCFIQGCTQVLPKLR